MKNKLLRVISQIILNLFLVTGNIWAQIPAIDTMYVIPSQPQISDSVYLVICATFPSGDCNISNTEVNTNGGIITVDVSYEVGAATYICSNCDTVTLGVFNEGPHSLNVFAFVGPSLTAFDSGTLNFTVNDAVGYKLFDNQNDVKYYPNPVYTELNVLCDYKINNIVLFDSRAVPIQLNFKWQDELWHADMTAIPSGFYVMMITDLYGKKRAIKLVKY